MGEAASGRVDEKLSTLPLPLCCCGRGVTELLFCVFSPFEGVTALSFALRGVGVFGQ